MKKAYVLLNCKTCQKILRELSLDPTWQIRDIKSKPLTETELVELHNLAGSYDALFSKRSMKYREWNLASKKLSEKEKHDLILKEYTFLKRPVFVYDHHIFIGSAKANVDLLKRKLT